MKAAQLAPLLRSTLIVLADSERTEEIHRVEEITGAVRLKAALERDFEGNEARALLRDRPELRSDQVDYAALRGLPPGSLGFQYVNHLDTHGLTADSQAADTEFVEDPTLAYLVRRFRQTHDVWHALTDLGTRGDEEVLLHAFSFGQLRLPVSALIIVFGGIKHLVLEARWGSLRRAVWEALRNGREAAPLLPVYWERHWEEPIDEVRARLRIRASTRAWVDA